MMRGTIRKWPAAAFSCALFIAPWCPPGKNLAASQPIDPFAYCIPNSNDLEARVTQGYQYIESEMERWTHGTVVYDDDDSGGASFFPSNWMGDLEDLTFENGFKDNPAAGDTCIKITYTPSGQNGWAGIYWSYPDGNWGDWTGYDLTGATQIRFMARSDRDREVVKFKIGGINRDPHHDSKKPYQDSFATDDVRKTLKKAWQPIDDIKIPKGVSAKNVIGGFAVIFSKALNPNGCVIYLDQVTYDNSNANSLRLIRSYTPTLDPNDRAIRNASFLYDNTLALLALLARKDEQSLRRARILADSIVWAQTHDRAYKDGRWRNAYSCGPLEDPATGTARLPGWYNKEVKRWAEDFYAVSSDTGNASWAIVALLSAHAILEAGKKGSPYLQAAHRAAQWIENNFRVDDALGGYTGGFEGWDRTPKRPIEPSKIEWRSTEHNIDLYVAFSKLAMTPGNQVWQERATHARQFVLKMWNARERFFWTGIRDKHGTINTEAVPADVQTWAVLAMGHDSEFRRTIGWAGPPTVPDCLDWVNKKCRLEAGAECPNAGGYRFSNNGRGGWFEGSSHVAATYSYLGDSKQSREILEEVLRANPVVQPGQGGETGAGVPISSGGIYAACSSIAETGFYKVFVPSLDGKPPLVGKWTYPRRLHLGATAWFVLAARSANPYWIEGRPAVTK